MGDVTVRGERRLPSLSLSDKRFRYNAVRERDEGDVIAVFSFIGRSRGRSAGSGRKGWFPQDGLVCANTSLTSLTGHGSALWSGKEWVSQERIMDR